jgi:hypothetical protein
VCFINSGACVFVGCDELGGAIIANAQLLHGVAIATPAGNDIMENTSTFRTLQHFLHLLIFMATIDTTFTSQHINGG